MCHSRELFTNFLSLSRPITVTLPNGKKEIVTHVGTVIITRDSVIHEVLYIPSFKYNLLSVSKCSNQDGSCVIFTSKYCIMQAPLVKKPQVLGELIGGLCLLKINRAISPEAAVSSFCFQHNSLPFSSSACTVEGSMHDILTWHAILGHLSLPNCSV